MKKSKKKQPQHSSNIVSLSSRLKKKEALSRSQPLSLDKRLLDIEEDQLRIIDLALESEERIQKLEQEIERLNSRILTLIQMLTQEDLMDDGT